ncbi:MAG: hypothetical protein HQ541_18850 [Mariniphaga sp.]|nr:hypothetical protein [Mariniphaga sp.]
MRGKSFYTIVLICVFFAANINLSFATDPVTPNASKEAKALLEFIYSISGKYTLTGQHNYPATKDRNSQFAAKYVGKTPAVWSSDMGFAEEGDTDSYLARPDIVKEAIRQHKKGSIITICWHAVPPTADEPVTFQPRRGVEVAPDALASAQGQLLDEQYAELMTPGTKLHNKWIKQVDAVAVFLKQLQEANIPILWRPYHEMNGDWFWWGGRVGENSTIDIYKMLFDRYVNHHKLNNLVWVWNVDRPSTPIRKFSNFYPGTEYLDILSLDVYGADYQQAYYDSLMALSQGKPLLFGEVGDPPMPEILKEQSNWTLWTIWAGMVRLTSKDDYKILVDDPKTLHKEDPAYWKAMAPYRKASGLAELPLKPKYPINLSGEWVLNEEESESGGGGMGGNAAYKMIINHDDDIVSIKRYSIVEWGDDRVANDEILLDGTEIKTEFFNSPRISVAKWDDASQSVIVTTTTKFNRGGQETEMKSSEVWSLKEGGNVLVIEQTAPNFRGGGERTTVQVFEKEI